MSKNLFTVIRSKQIFLLPFRQMIMLTFGEEYKLKIISNPVFCHLVMEAFMFHAMFITLPYTSFRIEIIGVYLEH